MRSVFAVRQIPRIAVRKTVPDVEVRGATFATQVVRILSSSVPQRAVIDCLAPSVRSEERQPRRVSLLDTNLGGVVNRRGFRQTIGDTCERQFPGKRLIRPPRLDGTGTRCQWLIDVGCSIKLGTLRSDIAHFNK